MLLYHHCHNRSLFGVIWLHLPGSTGGINLAYSAIEPVIHRYIRTVRPSQSTQASAQDSSGKLNVLVSLGVITQQFVDSLVENVSDSWMILPVPILILTPGFMVRGGCIYTGLFVPALNATKALAHINNNKVSSSCAWMCHDATVAGPI